MEPSNKIAYEGEIKGFVEVRLTRSVVSGHSPKTS
jgi:hypothetical protein